MENRYQLDVGNIAITDTALVSGQQRSEAELLISATTAVKFLLAELLALPKSVKKGKNEGHLEMLQLPAPVTRLPREKAPPRPKPLTSWQKFALKKGIDIHRKKSGKVWDDEQGTWKDRWGKRAREDREKHDWLREVGENYVAREDGGDPFLDERRDKKARLDKEKKNKDHNQRRAEIMEKTQKEVTHLDTAIKSLSTASNGKFELNKIKRSKKMI